MQAPSPCEDLRDKDQQVICLFRLWLSGGGSSQGSEFPKERNWPPSPCCTHKRLPAPTPHPAAKQGMWYGPVAQPPQPGVTLLRLDFGQSESHVCHQLGPLRPLT